MEIQSSRGEAFSFFVRHLSPKIWTPVTREYTFHPAYLQVTVPQTKTFQKHLKKTENKKRTFNNFTNWLASVSEYTFQTSVFAVYPAIIPAAVVSDSKLFPSYFLRQNPQSFATCCFAGAAVTYHALLHHTLQRPTDIDHCNWKKVPTSLQLHSGVPLIAMAPLPGSLPLQVFIGGSEQWLPLVVMNRFRCMWPLGYLISATCTLADIVECIHGEVISLLGQPLPRGDRTNPWLCLTALWTL